MSDTPDLPAPRTFGAESAPVALLLLDASGVVDSTNSAARALLGDVAGQRLVDRAVAADQTRAEQLLASGVGRAVLHLSVPAGVIRCEVRIRDHAPGLRIASITEGLRESAWFDQQPDPAFVVLPWTFEVVRANRAALEVFGRPGHGWALPTAFPAGRKEGFRQRLQQGVEHPAPFVVELQTSGGVVVPVEVLASRSADDVGIVLAMRDLRSRRRLEDDQAREREQASELAHQDAVRRVMKELGVEVGSLVSASPAEAAPWLEPFRRLADSLAQLGRSSPAVERPFDLRDVVRAAGDAVRGSLPPRVELRVSVPDASPIPMVGDQAEWRDALASLVRWSAARLRLGGRVELVAWRVNQAFWLEVRDDGPEVPSDQECATLFEPFGGGPEGRLALAKVHATARAHGVGLVVTPRSLSGLTFTFHAACAPVTLVAASPPRGRLLIVDDDPQVRRSLGRILARAWTVVEAATGREGVRVVEAEAVDVVLCDMNLRNEHGVDVYRALRAVCPGLRVVVMSGATLEPSSCPGADAILHKPFSPDMLAHVLDEVARGGRVVGASGGESSR